MESMRDRPDDRLIVVGDRTITVALHQSWSTCLDRAGCFVRLRHVGLPSSGASQLAPRGFGFIRVVVVGNDRLSTNPTGATSMTCSNCLR